MIGSVRPTGPHAPKIRRKYDYGQKKEDTGDLKPDNSADAPEGAQKAAYATGNATAGLNGLPGGPGSCLALDGRRRIRLNLRRGLLLDLRWGLLPRGGSCRRRQPLAGHLAGDAQSRAKNPSNFLWSHSVYDGSSDAG